MESYGPVYDIQLARRFRGDPFAPPGPSDRELARRFRGDPFAPPGPDTTERMKSFIRSVASAPYGSQQNGRRALWRRLVPLESQGRGCARPAPEGH